jgi:hypothetical protein
MVNPALENGQKGCEKRDAKGERKYIYSKRLAGNA